METLTDRQYEIASLVAEGLTNKQIGKRLGISVETVRKHTQAIYAKTEVNNRVRLTHLVLQLAGQKEGSDEQ